MISPHVNVTIDLTRIRDDAAALAARVRVPVWATIKADAYGLGAAQVATTLANVPGVVGFYVFTLDEATSIDLWNRTHKPAITLGPPATLDPQTWLAAHVRPAVATTEQAAALRDAHPVLCVDTGMQRFACAPDQIDRAIEAGGIDEAFTHATRLEHVQRLRELCAGRGLKLHAAATALLDEPAACLDAVRPGLALYRGAVRVTTRLAEAHHSIGPIGYTAWTSETAHHGVIVAGYSNFLRPGPVLINGRRQHITEIGMQSAYLTLHPDDRAGDEVVLLGDGLTETDLAFAWNVTPHQALFTMASMGGREWIGRGETSDARPSS
ncbi:MAG TPA: alanine racemase [Tepidisphaeraceae bacterium]|jgi:alanine racemase